MKFVACTLMLLFVLPPIAAAQFNAVVSVAPAVDGACIAVEISTGSAALSGLRWYHNDGTQVFPRVVLVEGEAGMAPDLTNPGLILDEVSGVSAGWGELTLASPVTSSTGTAYAVFFFPAGVATTALGEGGGPGLGIRETEAEAQNAPFYITADALHWARFSPGFELGVEPVHAALRGTPRTIAEIGVRIDLPEPVESLPEEPARPTGLRAAVPNPFNPRTTLSFSLANSAHVDLKVYDLRGRLSRTLVAETRSAGEHLVVWDGKDEHHRQVASGVYFARFEADAVVQTHRLVLLK